MQTRTFLPRGRYGARAAVLLAAIALPFLSAPASATFTKSAAASHGAATASCFYRSSVQSGSTTSTANGTTTVTITSVTMAKAFLVFSTRHNSNRPVGSEVTGRLASATTVEFNRVTDESSPVTITIQWYVVEYNCGVNVQRGVATPTNPTTDVTITAVNSVAAAFVTWSKTPSATDTGWGDNDPMLGVLTSTTNLQLRQNTGDAGHAVWWQVIEFTDSTKINVQTGTTSLTGGSTSTTATLATAVTTSRTFVLVGTRSSGAGTDIGSGMVRGQLTNSTTITLDRSAAGYDVTEISWQAVELKEGTTVQTGTTTLGSGTSSATASLTALVLNRSTAFASTQTGGGQNGGRTAYTADDVIGVAAATLALTSTTQLTLTRSSTAAAADIAWFVVSWGLP